MKKPMKHKLLMLAVLALSFGARAEIACDFESEILESEIWHYDAESGVSEFLTETYDYTSPRPLPDSTHTKTLAINDATMTSPVLATAAQTITSTGVYVDTMIKFTPSIDNNFVLAKNDKLALWAVEETVGGAIKLVAKAGKLTDWENNVEPFLYDLTPDGFDATAWHRLTVKALKFGEGVLGGTVYGFVVFLDGELLTYAGKPATEDATYTVLEYLDATAAQYYTAGAERNALLPSLFTGSGKDAIAACAFAGRGVLDDFVLTTTAPSYAEHQLKFSLSWDAGIAEISVNNALVDLTAENPKVFDLATDPQTFAITAKIKEGYLSDWVNGERSVSAGEEIKITTAMTAFSVGDVKYPDTTEGRFEAIRDAMTSARPLLLNADYAGRTLYIEYPAGAIGAARELTLDLKGHTLGPVAGGPTIYVHTGVTLKIVDSFGGGKVLSSAPAKEALLALGNVRIEAGAFEGRLVSAVPESIVFAGGTIAQEGDDPHFPYRTVIGKDAFLAEGVWSIKDATQALVRVPAVEHATYAIAANDTPLEPSAYDEYRVDFGTTVTIKWTAERGYRVRSGAEQTIDGTSVSLVNSQPEIIAPVVELTPYEITYIYQTPEGEPIEFAGENGNKRRYTILTAVTIEPSLISDETYAVTQVAPEKIACGSTGDVEVIVTLVEKSGKSWADLKSTTEVEGLSSKLKTVELETLATWAEQNALPVESAPIIKANALLFNCANTEAAIEAKVKDFHFSAEDVEKLLSGEELTTLNGVEHNGTFVIYGSTDLKNWHPKQAGDRFFKGRLTLTTEEAE